MAIATASLPRIGISARLRAGSAGAAGGLRKHLLGAETSLVDLLAALDALPFVLAYPLSQTGAALRRLAEGMLANLDGLVLQGGADVAPVSYGAQPLRAEWQGDAQRDQFEQALLAAALAQQKPVLGLCRGCQLINVAYGGTLFQDLPSQRGGSVSHSEPQHYDEHVHGVRLAAGGLLAGCHGLREGRVTSAHHQGIDQLGAGLVADAWCREDGLVEALRAHSGWVVGVQWHAELQAGRSGLLPPEPLFNAFLAQARHAEPARWSA
jgi:putative glutamine amidotransferase